MDFKDNVPGIIFLQMKKSRIRGTKGQIAGQIFIYIMAVVVVGIIVLVGYWAIKNVLSKSCQVQQIAFQDKLIAMIESHNDYESVEKIIIGAPCDYDTICFVDTSKVGVGASINCKNSIIKSSILDNEKKNIFMVSTKSTTPLGYSAFVAVEAPENCTCINDRNKNFRLTLQGRGAKTIISETE